jgi:hypothetical protein
MEEWLRLSRHNTAAEVNPTHYRCLIGSLHYLVHTRPDLAFVVGFVSRFMERPTVEHQGAVKRILRYVAGMLDYGLHFTKAPSSARFIGYCDSNLASDIDTSKSTSGTLFFLGNCLGNRSRRRWWRSPAVKQSTLPPLLLQLKLYGSQSY